VRDIKKLKVQNCCRVSPRKFYTAPLTVQTSLPPIVHLSLHLKKHLAGRKFREDKEVENEFATWLHVQIV